MTLQETNLETESSLTKTKFGIPIDYSFSKPASEESIKLALDSLTRNGFEVKVVDTAVDARVLLEKILPQDKTIFTSSSETLRISGLEEEINGANSRFKSLRQELAKMDFNTQFRQMVKMGAVPDVVVGSVHAVTESGSVLIASGSGSQIAPYVTGAEKVFWVVGSQKIVKDLETGLRRIELYSLPLEDIRMHEVRNKGSAVGKILIVNRDTLGRTSIVLIREPIGF